MALCTKGKELLRELQRSDWLPTYNEDLMRQTVEEVTALHEQIMEKLRVYGDEIEQHQSIHCGLIVNHQCLLRNKRCIMAYLYERTEKIKNLRWETGTIIPPALAPQLNPKEVQFFHAYDQLLTDYMSGYGLDLSADAKPPKDLYVEVRVLKGCGEIMTETGAVNLEANSTHFLRRSKMATEVSAQAVLARNLLSSVLALAFPDALLSDAAAQEAFVTHSAQVEQLLHEHNVFGLVTDGKALDKFQTKLFQLIDEYGLPKDVLVAALRLMRVLLNQCTLEQLEQLMPRVFERVVKIVKHQNDSAVAVAAACDAARSLFRHFELYTPETRKEVFDVVPKLLPALLSQLNALTKVIPVASEQLQLWTSSLELLIEVLRVSPATLRSYAGKIENVCVLALNAHALSAASHEQLALAAQCLAALPCASDKQHAHWKAMVDKCVEMLHQQVDQLSGKRSTAVAQPTGFKAWVKEATDETVLSVYQRANLVSRRMAFTTTVVAACMESRGISEREVQLVLGEVLAEARRAVAVRAQEVGKQTAVSEDGFRLPASVVYGVIGPVHASALAVVAAVVSRAGTCALRQSTKISKLLLLATENVPVDAHSALCDAVTACAQALGASTLDKVGVPMLDHLVARCRTDLEEAQGQANAMAAAAANDKKGKGGGKGKKRKRQTDVSQLVAGAASSLPFLTARTHELLGRNFDATLRSIATCVAVYGCMLPSNVRAAASDVSMLALQWKQQQERKAEGLNLLLMANLVSADAHGAHGAHLVTAMQHWQHAARDPWTLMAKTAGEALLHPRAPPLAIELPDATTAQQQQQRQRNSTFGTHNGTAANRVRGHLDWEKEQAPAADDDDDAMDSDAKSECEPEDEAMAEGKSDEKDAAEPPVKKAKAKEESDEEDEEEDYDDERPASSKTVEEAAKEEEDEDDEEEKDRNSGSKPAAVPSTAAKEDLEEDDDDDEFPDIVDDEPDDD
ncbi:TPA: hypothetical protein N0F65_001012 [Lagenidium giganteum]|uniref:GINS subunit domain-containing protein n=1 Tax=Lagenidium giganteum TaxID=4803 RepID=A0AAV2YYZ8_9STRA|nr:TPA: hypothetical protein N0F65_001012 [Lagenidium giganteum]